VLSKIELEGSILKKVKKINYLGCELSLDDELDFDDKIHRFQRICGTIRKYLKQTRTDTQMKFYKAVARPALPYGSKTWVTMKGDTTRLEAADMCFLRSVKGYTRLDEIRNEVMRKELEICGIQDVRSKHKQNWINCLDRKNLEICGIQDVRSKHKQNQINHLDRKLGDLWSTRREIQTQTKLDQPS
jgi:hypothetical protein